MIVEQKLYDKMPDDIKKCFSALPNPGSDEVVGLFPQTHKSGNKAESIARRPANLSNGSSTQFSNGQLISYDDDSNSAARFFYCAKAGKSERNKGLEGFEEQGGKAGQLTAQGNTNPVCQDCKGSKFDRGNGMCKCDTPNWKATNKPQANHHPTVKPIKLMQYLVRLVTPANGTCLDPFNGSGATGIACKLEGFNYIGAELNPEYVEISNARIKAWGVDQQTSLI